MKTFILFIAGAGIFILSLKMFKYYFRKFKELDKYKFENRTTGGVIQFKTYEDSQKFQLDENRVKQIVIPAFLMFCGGLGIIIYVIYQMFF